MKETIEFETTQCVVVVLDTEQYFENEKLYIVKSYHKNNGKRTVRFGTTQQLYNLLLSYQYSVVMADKEKYDKYTIELSIRKMVR